MMNDNERELKALEEILEDRVMIYVPEWKGMCSVFEGEYEKINA